MHFTQNPIGSDDQLDLQDNAISFDYAMNSPAALWQDRFGKQHKTVQQALKDVGFKPAGFDFVTGGTLGIGDRDKCVFYPTDGYWYNWNGQLPYVVPANSSPTPGGKKGWGVVTRDERVIAREALRRTYLEVGLNLVEGSFEEGGVLVNSNDVLLHESTGKVYSGPVGVVAPGSVPRSPGFIDQSTSLGDVLVANYLVVSKSVSTAIADAIAVALSTGKKLVFPKNATLIIDSTGSYGDGYVRGIHFPAHDPYDVTKRFIVELNGVKFKAGAQNQIVLKISGSYGKYEGTYSVDANGFTGVVGTAIAPLKIDSTQVTSTWGGGNDATSVWNEICKSYTQGCDVGLLLAVGGNTSTGLNSACYYNTIYDPTHRDCRIGIRIVGGHLAGVGLANRNKIIGGGAFDYNSTKKAEIGISIEGGDTNRFIGYDFEGVPKAVKLVNKIGGDSAYNLFIGGIAEKCPIHVEMDSPINALIGCGFDSAKIFVGGMNKLPQTFIAADSYMKQSFMGFETIDSLGTRLKAGAYLADAGKKPRLSSNAVVDVLDIENVTAIHPDSRYTWTVFNGVCKLHVKLLFQGVTLTAPIKIALPEIPNNILYSSYGNIYPNMFPVCCVTSGQFMTIATFSHETDGLVNGKKFIKVSPPASNWSPGQFNKLNFEFSYQIE